MANLEKRKLTKSGTLLPSKTENGVSYTIVQLMDEEGEKFFVELADKNEDSSLVDNRNELLNWATFAEIDDEITIEGEFEEAEDYGFPGTINNFKIVEG